MRDGCRKRGQGPGWDIANMAPKLKKGQGGQDEGGPPPGAVISAAAKRYRTEDRVDSGMVTAAQIAMLGEPGHRMLSQPAAGHGCKDAAGLQYLKAYHGADARQADVGRFVALASVQGPTCWDEGPVCSRSCRFTCMRSAYAPLGLHARSSGGNGA